MRLAVDHLVHIFERQVMVEKIFGQILSRTDAIMTDHGQAKYAGE